MQPRNETDEYGRTGSLDEPRPKEQEGDPSAGTGEPSQYQPPTPTGSGAEPTYHDSPPVDSDQPLAESRTGSSGATRVDPENLPTGTETADTAYTGPAYASSPEVADGDRATVDGVPAGRAAGEPDWAGPTAVDRASADADATDGSAGRAAGEPDWAGPTAVDRAPAQADVTGAEDGRADALTADRADAPGAAVAGTEVTAAEVTAAELGGETGAAPAAAMPTGTGEHGENQPPLLADDRDSLRLRWREAQAGFVDDPREAVRQAGDLVGEAVQSLTMRLTQQWQAIGPDHGDAATEELRQALRRYRALFDRLLEL